METSVAEPGADMTASAATTPEIAYHGRLGEAWKLAIVNTLLTIVTLGVYRFWAKTRIRRYFWSRVTVEGEPVEYTGTGLELFLGFLIILLILAPLYGAMTVSQLFLASSPALAIALSFAPLLILLALIPVAVFRARRYRLSRTVWRGVRAGQTGSTWGYWRRAVFYGLIGWLTLGLLRPLAHARLTRHLMSNTWFGETRFRFDVRARDLMWRWLAAWALLVGAYAGLFFAVFLLSRRHEEITGGPPQEGEPFGFVTNLWASEPAYIILVGGLFIVLMMLAVAAFVNYRVFQTRLFTRSTAFGSLRFVSRIRFWRVVGVYFVLMLAYVALIVALPGFGALVFGEVGGVFGLVAVGVLAGTLFAPFVTHPLLSHYVATLEITGRFDLDEIVQNAETAPRTGEGLASVFDVDAM